MLLFPFVASTQIIMKTASFELNDHVDLKTGEHSNVEVTSDMFQFVYDCSTSAVKKDLFLNYYNDYSLCICPCLSSAIGSARPLYRYKKESEYIDPDVDLDDTTLFTKFDTIQSNPYETGCVLPYFVWKEAEAEKITIVVTTSDDKYALVILKRIYETADCSYTSGEPSNPVRYHSTYARLSGFHATWYIQMNGSTSFRGIDIRTGVTHNPYRRYPATLSCSAGYYTFLGRKVPMEQVRHKAMRRGTPSLFVVEDRGAARLMLK